jgi:hypothetical protein
VPTPMTAPDRLLAGGTEIFDDRATGLPDWDCAEAAAEDSAEPSDWDLADLADWEPEDPEGEPLELATPDPEASDPEISGPQVSGPQVSDPPVSDPQAERRGLGYAEGRSREALKGRPSGPARGDGGLFAAGGVADELLPGPRLAGFMADARAIGLGRLTDDELIGVMRAARRLASWSAAIELAAAGDLWRRRWAEEQAGDTGAASHADDEIAAALTLTRRAADQVLSLAIALRRLPLTSQALTAGDIDLPRAMVIADEVTGLGSEHAAAVETGIIGAAAGQTTGQLRAATRRAVLSADPRAARKRKERALLDARVERWDEHGGTAALAGRDLPPASVLAADQNLSALARQLKRAGAPGTLDQLRAQVYLALLTGTSVGSLIPLGPGTASGMSPSDSPVGFTGQAADSPASATSPGSCPPATPSAFGSLGVPANPGPSHPPGPSGPTAGPGTTASPGTSASPGNVACPGTPGTSASPGASGTCASPRNAASPGNVGTSTSPSTPGTGTSATFFASGTVNLTMPLASWLGLSDAPGNVAGYGPLDAADSRAIADVLSARPGTNWCLTLTDSHGRPVAHGCARAAPPPSPRRVEWPTGAPGAHGTRDGPADSPRDRPAGSPHDRPAGSPHDGPADGPRDGPVGSPHVEPAGSPHVEPAGSRRDGPRARARSMPQARAPDRTWIFSLTLLAGGDCDHATETASYGPSPSLRHLIEIRHATCTYPGCRRPAAHCDADHTVAYHRGGRTCLCNLAPLCRHHHQVKQTPGWRLDHTTLGTLTWTTPSGRRYTVTPPSYPS